MEHHDPANDTLREALWRRSLTPGQERELKSWLAAHPDQGAEWQEEQALTRILARLPEEPVPSNFTARVLDAIDRVEPEPVRSLGISILGWFKSMGWVPRLAGVAVLVVAGWVGHHQYQSAQRAAFARDVAAMSELASAVPSVEVWQDFDTIRNLESGAVADQELLALLQ